MMAYMQSNTSPNKAVNLQQDAFVPIRFDRQILPGAFEFALHHLIEHQADLSAFDDHYQNDQRGGKPLQKARSALCRGGPLQAAKARARWCSSASLNGPSENA